MNVPFSRSGAQRLADRTIVRAAGAILLLLFVTGIAPYGALRAACETGCCEGTSTPAMKPAAETGCGEDCAITGSAPSNAVPDVTPSRNTAPLAWAALATPEAAAVLLTPAPAAGRASAVESHHPAPGDAPVYLYNSVFLI